MVEQQKRLTRFRLTLQSFLLIGSCLAYWRAVRFVLPFHLAFSLRYRLTMPCVVQMGPRRPSRTRAE